MADLVNIRIEGDRGILEGSFFDMAKARHLIRDAIDDIGDAIETQVDKTVPVGTGEGPFEAGRLKAHPLERSEPIIGVVEPRVFLFAPGGGVGTPGIRGAGGQIAGAAPLGAEAGRLIARTVMELPEEPEHAKWVHNGTGVYGPRNSPIRPRRAKFMKFTYLGKRWRVRTVKGQRPQPYLTNAFLLIERTYVPVRLELLDAQIAAIT